MSYFTRWQISKGNKKGNPWRTAGGTFGNENTDADNVPYHHTNQKKQKTQKKKTTKFQDKLRAKIEEIRTNPARVRVAGYRVNESTEALREAVKTKQRTAIRWREELLEILGDAESVKTESLFMIVPKQVKRRSGVVYRVDGKPVALKESYANEVNIYDLRGDPRTPEEYWKDEASYDHFWRDKVAVRPKGREKIPFKKK